jgi:hypothetical protein
MGTLANVLWLLVVLLLVVWLVGLLANIGGAFIHLLLIVVLALIVINWLSGRRVV